MRMLKQFDTNKDGQISKQEAQDGIEKVFAAIDTNDDGALTPGEIRKHHEAQMEDPNAPDDQLGTNWRRAQRSADGRQRWPAEDIEARRA